MKAPATRSEHLVIWQEPHLFVLVAYWLAKLGHSGF
jgi:hypothetical protein